MTNPNTFAGNPLDRASGQRAQADWIAGQLAAEEARIVLFWQQKPLIALPDAGVAENGRAAPAWAHPGALAPLLARRDPVFLGFGGGGQDGGVQVPHFAVAVDEVADPLADPIVAMLGKFIDLRSIAPSLSGPDAAILAQAKAILEWHRTHGFCARCGSQTAMSDGGYRRHCSTCGGDHFPRTDPVVIMLVTDGDRCLLGRGVNFPPGRFSALAGFVEPGETIEEAVRREVLEEANIRVGAVRYRFSQPWPWPMSLMIGCEAVAETSEITIDPAELQDARWVTKTQAAEALAGDLSHGFEPPPPLAIAHQLMKAWVDGREI